MGPSRERRPCKKDAVHDGKCPRRLEHRTRLEVAPVVAQVRDLRPSNEIPPHLRRAWIVAFGVSDTAEIVDGSDESSDKCDIDEGDKQGIVR